MTNITDAIIRRHSVRTYSDTPFPADVYAHVEEIAARVRQYIPGQEARLMPIGSDIKEKIGTYGLFKGSRCYLAVVYKDIDALSPVNAGMVGEAAVIALTQLGIGTCWVGGTYSKGTVADIVKPEKDERIAALIVVGIPALRESLTSRLMSRVAGSKKRKPFDSLFDVPPDSPYRDALELMRLAPSAMNEQPWRALADADGNIDFYTVSTDGFRLLDMGIGLYHFSLEAGKGNFENRSNHAPTREHLQYVLSWVR